jgi:hypothetical protein
MVVSMKKGKAKEKKTLKDNANYQGGLKVPLPVKTDYGTGLPNKRVPTARSKGVKK